MVAHQTIEEMSHVLRIATRASELALRRARAVQAMLAIRGVESELVTFRTSGDKHFEEQLPAASTKTVFTKELETALLKGKAELAVHALSDVSTDPVPGLTIAGIAARDDPRDVLVLNRLLEATSIADLPRGTRIGTSSVRCRSLLRAMFADLEVVHLRGDLPTRLHKVEEGQVHGTVVSAAALQRLEVSQGIAAFLEPPAWLPTPGQGAIALQIRDDDDITGELVRPLDDARAHLDTSAERALLAALEGGLQSPVGALVVSNGESRVLYGVIVDLQGRQLLRGELPMDDAQPELVGVRVANELRTKGASRILDALRGATRVPSPQPD
jgi:hydroxymethylbilane synthase